MRRLSLLLITAATLAACDAEAPTTKSIAGWSVRLDEPGAKQAASRIAEDASGLEVRAGPNATLWHADGQATGSYRLSADVIHLDSGLHPHGAGLVFGGTEVDGPRQAYTYFLVRSDGHFLIKRRDGAGTHDVIAWSPHAAVSAEGEDGVTKNRLGVAVGAREIRFLVNGSEVHRAPRASLPTEGRYGFRLVHDLHVRFGPPDLEPLDP